MKKALLRIVPLLPLLLLAGCYFQRNTEQSPWKPETVARIVAGKTTRAEALELLGPPQKIVKLHQGEAYLFEHVVEKRTGMFALLLITHRIDRQRDGVALVVDKQGVVQAVGSRFDAEQASFGTPWGD